VLAAPGPILYVLSVHKLAQLDHQYIWHPFTQMHDWLKAEPIVITRGKGAVLWDAHGRSYLDANSSIWTNLHGHCHPKINRAVTRQLKKIAHSSALGLASEPASLLAARLVKAAAGRSAPVLNKVFFSDDGSTAMEVALKLSYEYWRRAGVKQPRFLGLAGAYHGDTVGAVSLGHIDLFHKAYGGLLFETESVMAPYCYRCPFNRAAPERADARTYRKCRWECVDAVEEKFAVANRRGRRITAFVVEPLMQGAAGLIPQPEGWLTRVAQIARNYRAHLIADEVMTGFGRVTEPRRGIFGFQQEQAGADRPDVPDFIALAKGLTGGYLPMAATLTTQAVFDAFLGEYHEFKTFFHGHSYTGNQLGASAALASLDLLEARASRTARAELARQFAAELETLWSLPQVGDIRRVGLVAAVELVSDWRTRAEFPLRDRAGIRVCEAMARRGVLTRPIGNVIVLMPPYCTTAVQLRKMVSTLAKSIREVFR
jgi:adenosylmethionine---8-amino-7-oxononanoate aminotransferase